MFTRTKDFERLISLTDLYTILENDQTLLTDVEELAKQKITGFLAHRYDLKQVFTDIQAFSLSKRYFVGTVVEYTEPEFDLNKTYTVGERLSYEGKIYEVIAQVQGTPPPDPNYYVYIMENALLFVVRRDTQGNYPDNAFNYLPSEDWFTGFNDIVGWDRQDALRIERQLDTLYFYVNNELKARASYKEDVPFPYRFALEPVQDSYKTGFVGYLSLISKIPENGVCLVNTENYFERKDPRNKVVLDWVLKIMLYELHSRINPRQIPDLRVKQYDDTLKELEKAGKGLINIDLPLQVKEEDRNVPFLFGSSPSDPFKF